MENNIIKEEEKYEMNEEKLIGEQINNISKENEFKEILYKYETYCFVLDGPYEQFKFNKFVNNHLKEIGLLRIEIVEYSTKKIHYIYINNITKLLFGNSQFINLYDDFYNNIIEIYEDGKVKLMNQTIGEILLIGWYPYF